MPKTLSQRASKLAPSTGIFGPDWARFRGAIMRIELEGEPPFVARFDARTHRDNVGFEARLMVLDEQLRPERVRFVPWPPEGKVTVIRQP